jgi:hypothetical protein
VSRPRRRRHPRPDVQTETDVVAIATFAARQPDGPHLGREVAGTAHVDTYARSKVASIRARRPSTTYRPPVAPSSTARLRAIVDQRRPQHYALSAAIRALARWVRRSAARVDGAAVRAARRSAGHRHDRLGSAVGGVRSPQVDVPVATFPGVGQPSAPVHAVRLDDRVRPATLSSEPPDHRSYVTAVRRAAKRAVQRGVLLPPDAA